jgi:hypothetical protein
MRQASTGSVDSGVLPAIQRCDISVAPSIATVSVVAVKALSPLVRSVHVDTP